MLWAQVCFESEKDVAFVSPEEFKLDDTKQVTHSPCEGPTVTHKGTAALFPLILVKALACNAGTPKPTLGEKPTPLRGEWTECSPHCSSPCWSLYKVLRDLQLQNSLGDVGTDSAENRFAAFSRLLPCTVVSARHSFPAWHYFQTPDSWPTFVWLLGLQRKDTFPSSSPIICGALPGRVLTPGWQSMGHSLCRWSRGPAHRVWHRPGWPRVPPGWCRVTCSNTHGNIILEINIPQKILPGPSKEVLVCAPRRSPQSPCDSQHFTWSEITFW